jgi:hypothetical protein
METNDRHCLNLNCGEGNGKRSLTIDFNVNKRTEATFWDEPTEELNAIPEGFHLSEKVTNKLPGMVFRDCLARKSRFSKS